MEIDKIKAEIVDMILCDAVFYYEFDLATGIIEQEVIGPDGTDYTSVMGISLPCDFDEVIQKNFTGAMNLRYASGSEATQTISKETLCRSFMSGRNKEVFFVYYPAKNVYYKLTYFMKKDPETDHVRVFVVCEAVTGTYMNQEARVADIRKLDLDLQKSNQELTVNRFIMEDLGVNYLSIFSVDLEMNKIVIQKIESEDIVKSALGKFSYELNYDEALGGYIDYFVVPEERETVRERFSREAIKKDLENSNSRTMRYNCRVGDGQVFCIEAHVVRAGGSTNQVIIGLKNVEDQVRLERDRLRQEHKRQKELEDYNRMLSEYNSIVSNAGLGIWYIFLKDGERPRLRPSNKMREILGITDLAMSEEEMYEYWDKGIVEEARPSVQASVQEMMSGKFSENTYKWKHPVKGVTYVRCGGTADILPDGTAVLSGYHSDVTDIVLEDEKKKESLENALIAAEKARTDQKLQHDIVTSLSRDFLNVFLVNLAEKSARILKLDGYVTEGLEPGTSKAYPYDKIVAQYIKDRVYSEDKKMMTETMNLDNVVCHLAGKPEYAGSYRVSDQGRVSYYQYKYTMTGDEGQMIAAFRNIDDIVEAEVQQKNALAEALDRAEKASKAKTDFLFNMSHDIRTPMNAIIGYTDLLKKNADNLELRNRYIENIQTSNRYLLDLINNVLDTARIESGKATLDEVLSDSYEIGRVLDTAFANEVAKKHIRYTIHNSVVHRYVYHDVTKMEQIMFNIVSNAVKYTPDGGSIDIYFSEEPADREGYANFTSIIKDTGIGISKEFLPHIFDTFSRERTVTDSKIIGTGLGMGIVKKLVELMGGTITVESELGRGTTVSFTIPHRIAEAPVKTENDGFVVTPEIFEGKRILLAEDNDLNAEIAMEILGEVGFKVEHAEDGIICVDMLNKHDAGYYDLILMDIQMPNMNGIKATSVIRSIPDKSKSQIPILAMTANAFEEDKQNALAAGMNGHIAKPIEVKKFMETLAKILK